MNSRNVVFIRFSFCVAGVRVLTAVWSEWGVKVSGTCVQTRALY